MMITRILYIFLSLVVAMPVAIAHPNTELRGNILEKLSDDPASGVEGHFFYNTTEKKPKVHNGTAYVPMGSGAGGGSVNYVPSPDSAVGWTESGGVLATTTTDADKLPNAGFDSQALLLTGTGSSPGSGKSACFVVGDAYRNSIVGFSFDKKTSSGFTSGSFTAALMKCSDDSCASCAAAKFIGGSDSIEISKGAGHVYAETLADATSYYIDFGGNYFGTADGEWLALSSITVGPDTQIMGAVVEETVQFTPQFTNATIGNGSVYGEYYQVGDKMRGRVAFVLGSTSSITGTLGFSLPDGLTPVSSGTPLYIGSSRITDNSTPANNQPSGQVYLQGTAINFSVAGGTSVNATSPFTWGTGDALRFDFEVPVAEWRGKGTTQYLGTDGARVPVLFFTRGHAAATVADGASATVVYGTTDLIDNYSIYNSANGEATIARDGYYEIEASVFGSKADNETFDLDILVNGTLKATQRHMVTGSANVAGYSVSLPLIQLSAGDVVTVLVREGTTGTTSLSLASNSGGSHFSIVERSLNSLRLAGLRLATADDPGLVGTGNITNAHIATDAAIAGSKVNPDFGSQNIVTTGNATIGDHVLLNNGSATFVRNSNVGGAINAHQDTTSQSSSSAIMFMSYRQLDDATNGAFIRFQDRNSSTLGTISAASASTVAYNTSSDRRLKHDIQTMDDGIERLKLIKPRYFKWNEDGSQSEGFIAQELLEVVPVAVTGSPDSDPETDPMSVDYGKLTPVLVAALQEAVNRIESLENEIEALKNAAGN